MKVREAKSRIRNIDEYQRALTLLAENEKEPFFKDVLRCSKDMLGEYKELLLERIENAELD